MGAKIQISLHLPDLTILPKRNNGPLVFTGSACFLPEAGFELKCL